MNIKTDRESTVYIIWQRTKYVKDHILYRLSYKLNRHVPFLSRPFYQLLALLKKASIERQFSEDINIDLKSIVDFLPTKIDHVLDIGAGMGGIDVLLSQRYNNQLHIHLLDKSATDKSIYYGFEDRTAFYNSLGVAKRLLINNGVPPKNIHVYEVGDEKNSPFDGKKYDIIMSFISWGYHYPLSMYMTDVKKSLQQNGIVLVDIRIDGNEFEVLKENFSEVREIYKTPYLRRVLAKNLI